MAFTKIDAKLAFESLRSEICPACGDRKQSRKSFCGGCYHQLPKHLAKALYCRIGQGYELAFEQALAHHGRKTPVMREHKEVTR